MKKFCILTVLFFSMSLTEAQTNFFKSFALFPNIDPGCVIQLPDSGFVIYSTDINPDQELRRVDKHGNIIWHKRLVNPGTDRAGAITLSSKNHILIAGRINTSVNLFRLDLNGNIIFQKLYSGTGAAPNDIVEDKWGNIYIVAQYAEVLKTDSTGTFKWRRDYQANYIESIIPISANRTLLVGSWFGVVGPFSNNDIIHIYIDSTGALIKQKGFGTDAYDQTQRAFMDTSKKIYTQLYQHNYATKDTAVGFMCTDTLGNHLWTRMVKGNFEGRSDAALLKDNSLICYVAETFGSNLLSSVLHFSNDGKALQHSVITTTSFNPAPYSEIISTSDGGFALMGNFVANDYGFLKAGPNLSPSCFTTISKSVWEKKNTMDEFTYNAYVPVVLASTASNSTYTLTPQSPTVVASCPSTTCNTTASFLSSTGNVCMGGTISFTNNGQSFSSCQWKVNSVPVATTSNFAHTFSNPGSYTITSVVTGACVDSASHLIYVDSIPNPNFNWVKRHAKVKYQSAMYKSGTFFSWSFNDSYIKNTDLDTIIHNYMTNGVYTVCLTQTNTCGSKQTCKTITITTNYTNSYHWMYKRPGFSTTISQSGVSLLQLADGSYFLAGSENGSGLLHSLDSAGNFKKSVYISTPASGYIECTTQTQDGGALVNGTTLSPYLHAFGRVDSSGTMSYIRTFSVTSIDRLGNCIELKDGRSVFCGGASAQGYLLTAGKNMSVQQYRGFFGVRAITAIRKAPSGCYYAYGNNSSNLDPLLIKMDSSFNILWAKEYNLGTTQYLASDMRISPSEKVYMTGSYSTAVPTSCAAFVLAVDSAGNSIFAGNYKRTVGADYGRSIFLDKKGHVLVNSYFSFTYGGSLIKMDTLGNASSIQTFSMTTSRLLPTYDDGISVAASTNGGSASAAYTVAAFKLDTSGVIPCKALTTLTVTPVIPIVTPISIGTGTGMPVFGGFGGPTSYSANPTLICAGTLLVTSIISNEENNSFLIYPNPATTVITIVNENKDNLSVELVNSFGQILFTNESKEKKLDIDLQSYEAGIYLIRARNKDGTTNTRKIIKLN